MNYFESAVKLLGDMEALGYEAYLVGGCVRDLLLKAPVNDIDITTNMPLEVMRAHFELIDNGSLYSSVTIKYNDYLYETTHFRHDVSYRDHRHPVVEDCDSLEEDTKRRDFTINALAYDKNGKILDFHHGLEDLKNGVLRAIGDPYLRFEEDALRILRVLYFIGKTGFYIEEETTRAMNDKCSLLESLSDERIFDYFKRILFAKYDYGIQYIEHFDLFRFIPEYKALLSVVKRTYREEDLVFYYAMKYHHFMRITSLGEKKVAEEGWKLIENNFDNYSLYKYKKSYLRLENVFLNLGVNTKDIDERLRGFVLNEKQGLAIDGNDLKEYYSGKEIGTMLESATRAVLNGEILNNKEDIINYLKG